MLRGFRFSYLEVPSSRKYRSSGRAAGAQRTACVWIALLFAAGTAVRAAPGAPKDTPFLGRFQFHTYGNEEGLSDLSVECVIQDRLGFLWAGTDDGLFRFDGKRLEKFGAEQGLPQTRVYQLYETPGECSTWAPGRGSRATRGRSSSSSAPGPGWAAWRSATRESRPTRRATSTSEPTAGSSWGAATASCRTGRRMRKEKPRSRASTSTATVSCTSRGEGSSFAGNPGASWNSGGPGVFRATRRSIRWRRTRPAASGCGRSSASSCSCRGASVSSAATKGCRTRASSGASRSTTPVGSSYRPSRGSPASTGIPGG